MSEPTPQTKTPVLVETKSSAVAGGPEWRQPSEYVDDNPNKADVPKEFVKHQKVWVNKSIGRESDWVEATVVDFEKHNGAWLYQLKDKNNDVLWNGNPTWFRASQLHADK